MILQYIHVLRHRNHCGNESLTVGAEVFENASQGVHITLVAHLLKHKHDGIHSVTRRIEILNGLVGYAEFLCNKVVIFLQSNDKLTHSGRSNLGHKHHRRTC